MYRATTPTHTFKLPIDIAECNEIQVTYKQGYIIVSKWYKDGVIPSGMSLDTDSIYIRLTQKETLKFTPDKPAKVQVRVLTTAGDVMASQIFEVVVNDTLNKEVLE